MTEGLHIDPASLNNLSINFKAFQKEVLAASVKGLSAFGMRIVAEAQILLRKHNNIATGDLRDSGRTVVQPDNTVDAGFYAMYAYYVENGRRAGGLPPIDEIYQWIVKKKLQPSGKGNLDTRRREMAERIAWGIKHHGTKPHPFLKPAYEKYRIKIGEFMQRRINEVANKYKMKK